MTLHVSTVSPAGNEGDIQGGGKRYISLSSWAAEQQSIHTTNDQSEVYCYKGDYGSGGLDDTLNLSSFVTSPTSTVKVAAAPGSEANGSLGTDFNSYFFLNSTSTGVQAILSGDTYSIFEDLRIGSGVRAALDLRGNCIARRCTLSAATASTSRAPIYINNVSTRLENCIGYNTADNNFGYGILLNTIGAIYNCLGIGTGQGHGINLRNVNPKLRNFIAVSLGSGTPIVSGGSNTDALNCASSGAAAGGWIDPIENVSLVDGVDFVAPSTNDWRAQPGGVLDSAGFNVFADDGSFQDDIVRYIRPAAGPWTLDPFEIQGGAPGVDLDADALSQFQFLDSPSLSQAHNLTADPIAQAQSLSTVAISLASTLGLDGLEQAQSLNAVLITQAGQLELGPIEQAQSLSELGITQAHLITPSSIEQGQRIDPVSLLVAGLINLEQLEQAQSLSSPTITQVYPELQVSALTQSQVLGNATLSQSIQLLVDAINQNQTIPPLPLTAANILYLTGIEQEQAIREVDASQAYLLQLDELTQDQILSSVRLGGLLIGYLEGELCIITALEGELSIN